MPKKVITASKKVAPKKVVAKKAASKKAVPAKTKTGAKKSLVYADNTHSFWLHDGQILNSLMALDIALREMEKKVFAHHVESDRHDFADWVDIVLGDVACAADLRKSKTPKSAQTVVAKYLKVYEL